MLEWQDQLVDFLVTLYFETVCLQLNVMPSFPDVSGEKNTIKLKYLLREIIAAATKYNAAKRRLDNELYGCNKHEICKLQWF